MNAQGEEVSLDEVFADMRAKAGGELAQASSVTALKKPPPPSQPLAALDVTDVADGHRLRPGLGSYTLAA